MSFGTLELIVEINQSKANSSAKTVANSMSGIIKDTLKDSTKDVFNNLVSDSKSASDTIKTNLSSILSAVSVIKKDFASVFTNQNLKVTLETQALKDKLTEIKELKKSLESKTNIDIAVDIAKAKSSIESLHKSIETLQRVKGLDITVDTSKANKSLDNLQEKLKLISTTASIEVKANIVRALESVNLVNKDIDRISKREATELKLNADRARQELDLISRELDRIQSQTNVELKISADKAKQELASIEKALDRIAARENLELKLDADRAKQQLDLISKDLDRVSRERIAQINIDARQAEQELKRLEREQDKIERELKAKVTLDANQAKQDAKDLQGIRDAIDKDIRIQIELDAKQAEQDLARFAKQIADTKNVRSTIQVQGLETNIASGKAQNRDTSGLERELALVNELNRHTDQLSKVRKLNLDIDELKRAEKELNDIHRLSNQTIELKFSESGLDRIRGEVNRTVDSAKSSLNSLSQGVMQGLGQQVFQSFTEGVRGAVGVVGGAVSTFSSFTDNLNQFRIFSGGTEQDMKSLADTARELAMTTSTTATGASKAAIEMVKLGFSASETKDQLKGVVSLSEATGLTDMSKAAEIAGAAYSVFGVNAEKTADIVSATANNSAASAEDMLQVLSKTGGVAKATGQSIETLSTAFGLMRNSGFTAESAATGLKTALLRLAAPSNDGRKALETLGVSVYDASGKMKPLLSMIPEFKTAMSGFDDASKMDLTRKIFGDRGGPAFLALMNQSQEKVDELYGKISNSDGSAKSSAAKLLEGLPGALKLAKGSIENLAIGLGEALSPALEAILRLGVDVANTLGKGDMFASLNEGSKTFALYLKDNDELVKAIVQGIQQLTTAIGTQLNVVAKDFVTYLKENPDAMKTMVQDVMDLAINLGLLVVAVAEFGKGFAEATLHLSSMFEPMADMFENLTGSKEGSASLAENLGKAAAYAIPLMLLGNLIGVISTIAGVVKTIVGLVGGWAVVGTTVTGIITGIGTTLLTIGSVIGGLVTGAISFGGAWTAIIATINPITVIIVAIGVTLYTIVTYAKNWDGVVLAFNQTVTYTQNLFKDIWEKIVSTIKNSEFLNSAWEILKSILLKVTEPYRFIFDTVVGLVQKSEFLTGVWNGIKGLAQGVGDVFKNVVGGVFDGLIKQAQSLGKQLQSMVGMGGSANRMGGGNITGKSNTFKDVVVTSAVDASGEPGMDYVTEANNGQGGRGAWVPSLTSGTVVEIREDNRELGMGGERGYGNVAIVRTLDEKSGEYVDLLYAHFDKLAVKVNDEVAVGTVLGTQGRTGSTSGTHTSVDFFAKASNVASSASLAMRNRLAADLNNGAKDLNSRIGQTQGGFSGGSKGIMGFANNSPIEGVSKVDGSSASTGSGGGWRREAFDAYRSAGFNANSSAAMVGTIQQESGGNASAVGDGGQANGLFQWHPNRRNGNYQHGNFRSQLGYSVEEMQSDQGGDFVERLKNAPSVSEAMRLSQKWIRFGHEGNRNQYAQQAFNDFSGSSPNSGSGNGSAVGEANDEISGLRSTVKEEEASRAEKEAEKAQREQDKINAKHQKAIESSRKMADQATTAKRKQEKDKRQQDKEDELTQLDTQIVSTVNPQAKQALEQRKKTLSLGSSESEKIIENEQKIEDLKVAKKKKVEDLKSPIEDVKQRAKEMPDYSQAIKDTEALLVKQREIRDRIMSNATLEYDTIQNAKTEELAKNKVLEERELSYQKQRRMLEELKSNAELETPDLVKGIDSQIKKLDLEHETNKALTEQEFLLKKLTAERKQYAATIKDPAKLKSDPALKLMDGEIDSLNKKITSIKSSSASKLKIIENEDLRNAKEMAQALGEIEASKDSTLNASRTNLARGKASVLRNGGDEFGANAIERKAAKEDQVIKNRDRKIADDKDIEAKSKTQLPYTPAQIKEIRDNTEALNAIDLSKAGSEFKTLGETIGTTFKESVGTFFKDVLSGSKSVGEAFSGMIDNMLNKLIELAVNSLIKDLFGGMFSGGGGGGGGIFGGIIKMFGGGMSEGGIVPNYADGNLQTLGGNRPYLSGQPFMTSPNSPITKALRREGSGGVVSVLKANELVLTPSQTKSFFAMGMDQQLSGNVANYAEGNLSSFTSTNSTSTTSGSNNVTVPITINMSGNDDKDKSGINVPRLQDEVRKTVIAEIQQQQRNGGGLASNRG